MTLKTCAWLLQRSIILAIGFLFIGACRFTPTPSADLGLILNFSSDQVYIGDPVSVWVDSTTTGSVGYIWRIEGVVQEGENSDSFSFIPDIPKRYKISVTVSADNKAETISGTIVAIEKPPPTPSATLSPIPTNTPIFTPTFTPTITPTTSIDTPLPTPTFTPTPTSTSTPAAQPLSITILQNMNIRSGPDTIYPVIGVGSPNDTAKLLGRNKDSSWLQIEYLSTEDKVAWIYRQLVQLNGDINEIPIVETPPPPPPTSTPTIPSATPTSEFTKYSPPILTNPDIGSGAFATFPPLAWTWEGELAEDEFFEVRVWHEELPYHAALGWVKQPNFDYNVSGERHGKYFWTVIIVQGENERRKQWTLQPWWPYPMWEGDLVQELSGESEPRFFFFTPNSSGGGGGSGGPLSNPPGSGGSSCNDPSDPNC